MSTTIAPHLDASTGRYVSKDAVKDARRNLGNTETYRAVAELFGALSDPTRLTIVHALCGRELCTCDLAEVLHVTESAVSQHLRILRSLRIVRARRAGKYVFYALDDAHVSALLALGLTHHGHVGKPMTGPSA